MIELIKAMERLQAEESKRANAIHGDTFASFAEGWLALEEEIDLAKSDITEMNYCRNDVLSSVREMTGKEVMKSKLERLRHNAIHAACELVQVAHVAHKMINSPDVWENKTEGNSLERR